MRKIKTFMAFLTAMTMVFGAVNITAYADENASDGKTTLTAEKSNSRTATISVIDEETGELVDQDMGLQLLGHPSNMVEGAGGTIFVGGWDSSKKNPYTFEELPEDFTFFVQYIQISHDGKLTHDGVEYDGYEYWIDDEKSERSFEVTNGVPKEVKIYAKKNYYKHVAKDETNVTVAPTLKGDVDLNGEVSLSDVVCLSKYNLNSKLFPLANDTALANADMNSDGEVNGLDTSALIEQQLGGAYTESAPEPLSNETVELTKNITPISIQASKPDSKFENSQIDFAVSLLQNTLEENKNTLVSPYSAAQALAMTANGAQNNTLKELMDVIGGGMDIDSFNKNMAGFRENRPIEEYGRLLTANSIWYKNDKRRFIADENFLLTNKSYYDAQIYSAPMNSDTINDINDWVKLHTEGMIPKIVDKFEDDVIMALVNAVSFDAEWQIPFDGSTDRKGFFTAADGKAQDAKVLSDTHYENYLKDDEASGVLYNYSGGKYAFAAILPNEGISANEYTKGLTAEKFSSLLNSAETVKVKLQMPKFSVDYSQDLNDTLKAMGIKDAFDENKADFEKMGTAELGGIHINKVLQKTHIDVDEEGTKAAAATYIEMGAPTSAAPDLTEPKQVILNRPFVYAIVDTETNIPIFIGTLNTLE